MPIEKAGAVVPDQREELEQALYALTMEHLAKLAEYIPGPIKKKGTRDKLLIEHFQFHSIAYPECWK